MSPDLPSSVTLSSIYASLGHGFDHGVVRPYQDPRGLCSIPVFSLSSYQRRQKLVLNVACEVLFSSFPFGSLLCDLRLHSVNCSVSRFVFLSRLLPLWYPYPRKVLFFIFESYISQHISLPFLLLMFTLVWKWCRTIMQS